VAAIKEINRKARRARRKYGRGISTEQSDSISIEVQLAILYFRRAPCALYVPKRDRTRFNAACRTAGFEA
jgi:hypothetical protein